MKTSSVKSNKFREYYKDAKNPMLLELLDEYEKLLEKSEQRPTKEKKMDTIDAIIVYCDREFKKKFGEDEIFTDFPIAATIIMKLSYFRSKRDIPFPLYKDFAYWLVHKPALTKRLNRKVNVYDLCNEALYKQFLKDRENNDFDVAERKKTHNKKVLRLK